MNPALFRHVVHPVIHALRGEAIGADRARIRAAQWHDAEAVAERQIEAVGARVAHFAVQSPTYARLLAEAGPSERRIRDVADLRSLPVMERDDLAAVVRELRESPGKRPPHDLRLSGGSTGVPTVVLADRVTTSRSLAARAECQSWYGILPGDRQARFWGRPLTHGRVRQRAKDLLLNRIRIDSLAVGPARLDATIERIRRFAPEYLYGYTSLVRMFAEAVVAQGARDRIGQFKGAIVTSETVNERQARDLAVALECPVIVEYGCSEVDIISFQCPEGSQHVIADNVLLEVVPFGDEPEGYGQAVVTDLHNSLMPVLRYRLGDLIPLEATGPCACGRGWPAHGPVLGRAQGQYIELVDGSRLHSQFIVYIVEELVARGAPIRRFRIVQEALDRLCLQVVPVEGANVAYDSFRDSLLGQSRAVFGDQVEWRVESVDDEEIHGRGANKFRQFVSRVEAPDPGREASS